MTLPSTFLNFPNSSAVYIFPRAKHFFKLQSGKKNGVTRVTTEEEGYVMNSPKIVKQKSKQTKDSIDASKITEFDISLSALSDVDLSCADEVLRETYNFKYSGENVESQESLNSILAPAQLIDHVLQEADTSIPAQKSSIIDTKQYEIVSELNFVDNILPVNYRAAAATCRQYSNFGDVLSNDYAAQIANKMDNQYLNSSFDGTGAMMDNAYNRQYASQYTQQVPAEDETSFSYSKWLNEIYDNRWIVFDLILFNLEEFLTCTSNLSESVSCEWCRMNHKGCHFLNEMATWCIFPCTQGKIPVIDHFFWEECGDVIYDLIVIIFLKSSLKPVTMLF